MGEEEPKQVIMLGYNSWKFDDNFLLHHLRQKLVFTCDAMSMIKLKGTSQNEFLAHGGNKDKIEDMHDALQDCKAVFYFCYKKNNIDYLNVFNNTRSLKSFFDRTTNPLLKAGFITDTIVKKLQNK